MGWRPPAPPKSLFFRVRRYLPLVLSACEHNERGIFLVLYVSLPSLRPPPPIQFLGQTDRDEALIFPQLQKYNRAGVKSYGLAHN